MKIVLHDLFNQQIVISTSLIEKDVIRRSTILTPQFRRPRVPYRTLLKKLKANLKAQNVVIKLVTKVLINLALLIELLMRDLDLYIVVIVVEVFCKTHSVTGSRICLEGRTVLWWKLRISKRDYKRHSKLRSMILKMCLFLMIKTNTSMELILEYYILALVFYYKELLFAIIIKLIKLCVNDIKEQNHFLFIIVSLLRIFWI